jgi:hypothetical protein
MAEIVLGIGTSHSPMLSLEAGQWKHRSEGDMQRKDLAMVDGRRLDYAQLLRERGSLYADDMALAVFERRAQACQRALDRLADVLEAANPDAVVIVGDDQTELFSSQNQPAFAIFHGDEIATTPGRYGNSETDWMQQIGRGYMMDQVHRLPAAPRLAEQLIEGLVEREVDVTAVGAVADPAKAGFGHAYGFVVQRLFRRPIPVVPVLLNTYYPPNVPGARRCYDIGTRLRDAVRALPGTERVAVVASGGLSHFVVDEAFDRSVLDALQTRDGARLQAISRSALKSGSSETLNWILTAGAVDFMPLSFSDYQPLYRTEAGTGIGAAFCVWSH